MKTLFSLGLLLLAVSGAHAAELVKAAASPSPSMERSVEEETGGYYSEAHLDALKAQYLERSEVPLTLAGLEKFRTNLISQALVAREARRKGVDADARVKAQMDLAADAVLVKTLTREFSAEHPVTENDALKYYEAEYVGNKAQKEYRVSHIVVGSRFEAEDLIRMLDKGESFGALVKLRSMDRGSRSNGGDLGWEVPSKAYEKAFADAVLALKMNKFTRTPVATSFGYHVVLLTGIRNGAVPPFYEVQRSITEKLATERLNGFIASLRARPPATSGGSEPR